LFHLYYGEGNESNSINAKNLKSPVLQLPALNKSEDILNTVIYGGSGATAICGGGDNAVHVVDFAHGNALPVDNMHCLYDVLELLCAMCVIPSV
jgi:hypothetical protein